MLPMRDRESGCNEWHHFAIYKFIALLLRAFFSREIDTGQLLNPGPLPPKGAQNDWLTAVSVAWRLWLTPGPNISVIIHFSDANTFYLPAQFTLHFHCHLFTLRHSCTFCLLNPHKYVTYITECIHTRILLKRRNTWNILGKCMNSFIPPASSGLIVLLLFVFLQG